MTLFEEAICFAVRKHSGQTRKFSNAPYILHPMEVATIVSTMTQDQETLCAAMLHDTVEDTDTTIEEIEQCFGSRVSQLVMSETEDKHRELPAEQTWYLRKKSSLDFMEHSDDRAIKMLWLGDKLSNLRSIFRAYHQAGDQIWQAFNQKDPAMHAWYYRKIAHNLSELADYPVYREYVYLVDTLFAEIELATP